MHSSCQSQTHIVSIWYGLPPLNVQWNSLLFPHICPTMIKLVEYGLQIVLLVLVLDLLLCFCILAGHRQDITVLRINNIELSPNLKWLYQINDNYAWITATTNLYVRSYIIYAIRDAWNSLGTRLAVCVHICAVCTITSLILFKIVDATQHIVHNLDNILEL